MRKLVSPTRHSSSNPTEIQKLRAELRAEKLARESAERRCLALEDKVRGLEERIERILKGQRATEEYLQKTIRKLEKDVADRDSKIAKQEKSLTWFRKKVFGSTTEKSGVEAKDRKERKNNRGQQRGAEGHGRTDRSSVAVGDVFELEEKCACAICGLAYKKLEQSEESSLFEYMEGLYQDIYLRGKYVSQCRCEGKKIVTAPAPPKLYPKTNIGNSLWVRLVVQKFLQGIPTNRTLKELSLHGFNLAQGTVTGGFKTINELIDPLYEEIARHCKAGDLWNGDETSWRIFDGGSVKSWFWLVASTDAVVYLLDESRSSAVPNSFFQGCRGVLMTDRFSSYKSIDDNVQNAWCWVHVRRDFLNLAMGIKHLKSWGSSWLRRIAKLFVLNHQRFKLWEAKKDLMDIQEELEAHIDHMRLMCDRQLKQELEDEQRKVLKSLKRHWDGLTLFLTDPRIPLHNNRAERLLRNLVILRKNSYGSGARWSGDFAAKLLSLFQTWLINGLDPERMLHWYFDECSKTPGRAPPLVKQFLPWTMSDEIKSVFALPKGYSTPG
jgi:transposase